VGGESSTAAIMASPALAFLLTVTLMLALACFVGCCCGMSLRPCARAARRGFWAAINGDADPEGRKVLYLRDVGLMSQCTYEAHLREPRYRAGTQGFLRSGEVDAGAPYVRRTLH
jgi:hypothetical protein